MNANSPAELRTRRPAGATSCPTYFLRFTAIATLLSTGAYAQGANVCANADVIAAAPASVSFDTNSPSDTPGVPATTTFASGCDGSNEVWFTFTPATSGSYQFDTCGSTFDTEIALFAGTCGSLIELGCNDDFCTLQSQLLMGLNGGTQYFISVGYWDGANGDWGSGTLNVSELVFPAAAGSISGWSSAVNGGTTPSYTNTNIVGPTVDDIGLITGATGVTYEMIVHGTNEGISSCILGAIAPTAGDSAALKFEQYPDAFGYGITEFGLVDNTFNGVNNQENVDVHLAFVADTSSGSSTLFVNGSNVGTVSSAPILSGIQGLGMIYRPNLGTLDSFYGVIRGLAVYEGLLSAQEIGDHSNAYFNGGLGTVYCVQTVPNQAGLIGELSASGSTSVASNDLVLEVDGLPPATFGYFLVSTTQGLAVMPNGARGNLCLAGNIGRYIGPGQIQNTGTTTGFSLLLNLVAIPTSTGPVTAMPGDTYNFQAWHRDLFNGALTSNFTNGLELTFQ